MGMPNRIARVTLTAVASEAGVSVSTASLILSERPGAIRNFNPETVRKVQRSAQRLGYQANLFASGLPTKGSAFFALIMHDLGLPEEHRRRHQWGFEGDLFAGVISAAAEAGVYPIVAIAGRQADETRIHSLERIISGGVFGTIVQSPNRLLEKLIKDGLKRSQPAAVIFPDRLSRWKSNAIDIDNLAMGQIAGRLFVRQNRRKWLIIHEGDAREPHALRRAGFQAQAKEAGAHLQQVKCPPWPQPTVVSDLLIPGFRKSPPEAVFTLTSEAAGGVIHACSRSGIEPGRDMLVVGCDCSLWQSVLSPRVTSLEASWNDVGLAAMEKLLSLRSRDKHLFPNVLLSPRLVPGETCPAQA
jgi:LacI family transcriptional regulator